MIAYWPFGGLSFQLGKFGPEPPFFGAPAHSAASALLSLQSSVCMELSIGSFSNCFYRNKIRLGIQIVLSRFIYYAEQLVLRRIRVWQGVIDSIQHERGWVAFGLNAGNALCIHCSTQQEGLIGLRYPHGIALATSHQAPVGTQAYKFP